LKLTEFIKISFGMDKIHKIKNSFSTLGHFVHTKRKRGMSILNLRIINQSLLVKWIWASSTKLIMKTNHLNYTYIVKRMVYNKFFAILQKY
jgi:hypothetical protein